MEGSEDGQDPSKEEVIKCMEALWRFCLVLFRLDTVVDE